MKRGFAVFAVGCILLAEGPDPWDKSQLLPPADLAARLSAKTPAKLLHVGFGALYRGRHIPGSEYAGPGSKPEGLEALRRAVAAVPKDAEIVIYCGCCPFDHCPNVRPAFKLLQDMGFTRVKVLAIPTNLATDWTGKGYPVETGPAR